MKADEVRQIAELARIKVGDDELAEIKESLSAILSLVDGLDEAALEGMDPLGHPLDIVQHLRADQVSEADDRENIQAAAPKIAGGMYLVPKVIG